VLRQEPMPDMARGAQEELGAPECSRELACKTPDGRELPVRGRPDTVHRVPPAVRHPDGAAVTGYLLYRVGHPLGKATLYGENAPHRLPVGPRPAA
jgi:hypothetical protein